MLTGLYCGLKEKKDRRSNGIDIYIFLLFTKKSSFLMLKLISVFLLAVLEHLTFRTKSRTLSWFAKEINSCFPFFDTK